MNKEIIKSNRCLIQTKSIGIKNPLFFQPKLTINAPGDVYEQEADAMADKVMRMPANEQPFFSPKPLSISRLQRKCQHCEEEESMQRKETGNEATVADTQTENYISSLNGKGHSLTKEERSFFEPRFGYDFSDVQLHRNGEANSSAKNVNALAYTHGNNVVFGTDQYQPNTDAGKQLMAHELTHVLQQNGSLQTKKIQRSEENQQPLADIQGLGMADLLQQLNGFTDDVLSDEEAGNAVGGPRLVIAMRAVEAKRNGSKNSFIANNQSGIDSLPPDQADSIKNFLGIPLASIAPPETQDQPPPTTTQADPQQATTTPQQPAPIVSDVDQQYNAALQNARQTDDWQDAAEKLNAFNYSDIRARLVQLSTAEIEYMHQGALDNPRVGAGSNIAQMTNPDLPPESKTPSATSSISNLDKQYLDAMQDGDWSTAAERLNAFNRDDILTRLAPLTQEQISNLHQGALFNPNVGLDSQIAQMTLPTPIVGTPEDFKSDPDYIDNFASAGYDPTSNTLHLFFNDGGEAILPLPLGGKPVLVFEKKSFLYNAGPNDFKIYPSIFNSSTIPTIVQWISDHKEEMELSRLLFNAGKDALKARSVPDDIWWLGLLAPAGNMGGRFISSRMRPAFNEPEPGEIPVVIDPIIGPGPKPELSLGSNTNKTLPTIDPLNTYANSIGEQAEAPIIKANWPDANQLPPKYSGFDAVRGGVRSYIQKWIKKDGVNINVVEETIEGGEWISIKTTDITTKEGIRAIVDRACSDIVNKSKSPLDPVPYEGDVYLRVMKPNPDKIILYIQGSGTTNDDLLIVAQETAALWKDHLNAPITIIIKGQ